MSSPPPAAAAVPPRLFYHPAYWCHSCDMSIGLPPSPTPNALLCPHCHRDSLEQMDMDDSDSPPAAPPRTAFSMDNASAAATFAPDDNFLLNSPYLHRLIHHLTATSAVANPRSDPAPKSSIDSLQEVSITAESDPTMLCPVCKDPFVVDSVAKLMPCKHTYHSDCIVPWLEINNSCPVCRFKLPPAVEDGRAENEGNGYVGHVRLEELVDDEVDLFGFRNTLRHIARRHRWNDEGNIGSGSEGNFFSPTQIAEVEERGGGNSERENSVETVSSWPRWPAEERGSGGGGNAAGAGDAFSRS
ncbi:E3 ubiquitin-protein ligase RZF1-like [Andrographis paniculata]|uniref:E3 ubiquitin-protein ligase RZF1-like n=1 Tax=Andrographis paniculata TaxID=175694 RepID=UPI0021E89472|nr:E3 ubiquitin-protein ligase RZF1-like [Andrographis paniculata]